MLRLVNPGTDTAQVTITGRDDAGDSGRDAHFLFLSPGATMLDSEALEATFGDGAGKWQLTVESTFADIWVMNLLQSPTGHLTNLSTEEAPPLVRADLEFLGSEILIVYDGGTERVPTTCNLARCTIEDHDTTIEELLSATDIVATRRGVDLGHGSLTHPEGEIRRWGGWLTGSMFAVHSGVLTDGEPGTPWFVSEKIIHAYTIGAPAGTNPVAGSAVWNGMMVGADTSGTATTGNFVQGDATVTVSFAAATVDVLIDRITDRSTGASHPNLEWSGLALTVADRWRVPGRNHRGPVLRLRASGSRRHLRARQPRRSVRSQPVV